jgi:DNA replication and repair protein RecF
MKAWQLRLEHFRSFDDATFNFEEKTAIIGNNGAGKSNLIEALRLLSVGKSFKTSRLDDVIRFGDPFFRLHWHSTQMEPKEVRFFYGSPYPTESIKERSLRVDGQERNWSEYWGKRPSVLFVPEDIEIVIGSPQIRRRYLDSILWQTNAAFRQEHLELGRVLRERSTLLFMVKTNRAGQDELYPWNELLLALTEKIRAHRQRFITFLEADLGRAVTIFASGASVQAKYETSRTDLADLVAEEVRLAQNLIGPHRDELVIHFNDQVARRFTSRGQARTIVVLLKLAESRFLEQETGHRPLILLDDMFSELDDPTAAALFNQFQSDDPIVATSITPNPLVKDWKEIHLP